ncbi:MAG: hypothetical protein CVT64_01310 [Actinobacteria bacterium HGW-Actinobacteria-4]|nr:MAG: hypothetical protein CVT64_01310 [Actinobacteria bacterium HGW-Actinobacteria-4]
MLELSPQVMILCGSLFIAYVTIAYGGYYLTRVARGAHKLTEFQKSFHRAGHGHAGMIVTVGIVAAVLSDATDLEGALGWLARAGVATAGLLMSAGFFFSSLGAGREKPSRWIWLLWAGALLLATSVLTLGVGLIQAAQ